MPLSGKSFQVRSMINFSTIRNSNKTKDVLNDEENVLGFAPSLSKQGSLAGAGCLINVNFPLK